jgi:hypothetical protein
VTSQKSGAKAHHASGNKRGNKNGADSKIAHKQDPQILLDIWIINI